MWDLSKSVFVLDWGYICRNQKSVVKKRLNSSRQCVFWAKYLNLFGQMYTYSLYYGIKFAEATMKTKGVILFFKEVKTC